MTHPYQVAVLSNKNEGTTEQPGLISRALYWVRKANIKMLHTICLQIHKNFEVIKFQRWRIDQWFRRIRDKGMKRARSSEVIKRQHKWSTWSNYSVPWLWWWIYKPCHMINQNKTKTTDTQMNTSQTGNSWIWPMDYININIVVVIFYHSFTRCYHFGKLGKGYDSVLFLKTTCEATVISVFLLLFFSHPVVSDSWTVNPWTGARRASVRHHLSEFAQVHVHWTKKPLALVCIKGAFESRLPRCYLQCVSFQTHQNWERSREMARQCLGSSCYL